MRHAVDPDEIPTASVGPDAGSPAPIDEPTLLRIKDLPKEVGVMLVSVGALGLALPGLMGTPAIIAGGLVLWPSSFTPLEGWFRRRNPDLYRRGMQQIGRFLDDLERRYPVMAKK
jgi:hypothetical protein